MARLPGTNLFLSRIESSILHHARTMLVRAGGQLRRIVCGGKGMASSRSGGAGFVVPGPREDAEAAEANAQRQAKPSKGGRRFGSAKPAVATASAGGRCAAPAAKMGHNPMGMGIYTLLISVSTTLAWITTTGPSTDIKRRSESL